jgi:hypothetical protein
VWKFFKKKILSNHYQKKFDDFLEAVNSFFKDWGRYREDFKQLLTLNFEIIN